MDAKKTQLMKDLIKAAVLALLPLLCCVITCLIHGKTIGDVSLLHSEWNDELFYFKQVESIVHYGFPQGFFGYNESHAILLSFAAWSPFLVIPLIIFGKIFGWGLLSPVICNLILLSASIFLFVFLTKPNIKRLSVFVFLYCVFPLFTRYILSGMPEIICISGLIILYALALSYGKAEHIVKLILMLLLAAFLTLMRPYLILFAFLPLYFFIKKAIKKKKTVLGIICSILYLIVTVSVYAMTTHYFCSEYLEPIFSSDFITTFFTAGITEGIKTFLYILRWKSTDFIKYTINGIKFGTASGAFFAGFLTCFALLIVNVLKHVNADKKKDSIAKEKNEYPNLNICLFHLIFCFFGMLMALILMYDLTDGSKHLLTFIAVSLFLISLCETKYFRSIAIIGTIFVYLFFVKATNPYDYAIPFKNDQTDANYTALKEQLSAQMNLVTENTPNYDNVVIWVFNDNDSNGQSIQWQNLYSVPAGFGISCCKKEYVSDHINELKSQYIMVAKDGETDLKCAASEAFEIIAENEKVRFYRISY